MAILDALEPQLVRLRARYAKTPLPRFLSWWGRELASLLPPRWRAALAEGSEALLVDRADNQVELRRESADGIRQIGTIGLDVAPDEQRAMFTRLRATIDEPTLRQFYCCLLYTSDAADE